MNKFCVLFIIALIVWRITEPTHVNSFVANFVQARNRWVNANQWKGA